VALARPRCLYCGAELPADLVTGRDVPREEGPDPRAGGPTGGDVPFRTLVVVELASATAEALGRGLGVSAYEAGLLLRRGEPILHGLFEEGSALGEEKRLRAEGLTVQTLPESEVRVPPLRALGGERDGDRLRLRTEDADVTLERRDLLLVVRGPIARQYQPAYRHRRLGSAGLEEGYRVHLHRRFDPRAVEIDTASFEVGFAATGSVRLEVDAWVDAVAQGVPRDEGFRWLPPAFGVAEPEPRTALAAAARLTRAGRGEGAGAGGESVVLDNVHQFRFYSAWRAALVRRRAIGSSD